ncbi:MAG: M42 family metallopeptidase [Anaerolineales bacterium]
MAKRPTVKPKPSAARSPDLQFLAQLSNAVAVSGDEGAVRKLIREAVRPYADEINVDALGNVLVVRRARRSSATRRAADRMLVAAHMDEVGFMVTAHDPDGTLKFETVGGVDERAWIGKPVVIGANRLPGAISAAPVHLLDAKERNTVVKLRSLRIDIGVDSAEAAKKLVQTGDRGTFATTFDVLGTAAGGGATTLRGKALDDRLGCATLVELLRGGPYPFELHAAFTVQEEVGLRGAKVAGFAVNPVAAFVIDCTPAYDLPHSVDERENVEYNTRLGLGPAIYLADRATLSDQRLVKHLQRTAEQSNLPYQFRQPGGGGTDAGAIHLSRGGVPSVSVSVPGRYLHTPAAHVRHADWRNTVQLMQAALQGWNAKVLKR